MPPTTTVNKIGLAKLPALPGNIQKLFPEIVQFELNSAFSTIPNTLRVVLESWLPVKYLHFEEEEFICEGVVIPPTFLALRIFAIAIRQDIPLNTKIQFEFNGTGDIRSSLFTYKNDWICDPNHLIYRIDSHQNVLMRCTCTVREGNSHCNMTSKHTYTETPVVSFVIGSEFKCLDYEQVTVLKHRQNESNKQTVYYLDEYFIIVQNYVDNGKSNLYYVDDSIKDVCIKEFVELKTLDSFINKTGEIFDDIVLISEESLLKSEQLLPMNHRLSFTTNGNIGAIQLLIDGCGYIINRLENIEWEHNSGNDDQTTILIAQNLQESQIAHCILWFFRFHPKCNFAILNKLVSDVKFDRTFVVKFDTSANSSSKKIIDECVLQIINIYRSMIEQFSTTDRDNSFTPKKAYEYKS